MDSAIPPSTRAIAGSGYVVAALLALGMARNHGGWVLPWQAAVGMGLAGLLLMGIAIKRLSQLLAHLRESEARYRLLADHSTDIIMSTDAAGVIRFISPSISQLLDLPPEALTGTIALKLVGRQHRRRVHEAHCRALAAHGETVQVEFLGERKLAGPRWFDANMRAVEAENGRVECVVLVIRDITERKEYETALALAALTDPLTGLPNRRKFLNAVDDVNHDGRQACVALFDLDHFKTVNDRFGHAAGDEVLKTFTRIARQNLRATDTLARIGGEEFALLLPGAGLDIGEMVCARLGAALAQAVTLHDGHQISVTTSIGLARLNGGAEQALAEADRALYQAKAAGRDRLRIAA